MLDVHLLRGQVHLRANDLAARRAREEARIKSEGTRPVRLVLEPATAELLADLASLNRRGLGASGGERWRAWRIVRVIESVSCRHLRIFSVCCQA